MDFKRQTELINKKGEEIFFDPKPLYSFDYLIRNSLGGNTYRGFHRINKSEKGAKYYFLNTFLENEEKIKGLIKNISNEDNVYELSSFIRNELHNKLKININNNQLLSFNKLQKPIDIMIEHLVSMGADFTEDRVRIVKFLQLPLDSEMFKSEFIFPQSDLSTLKIKRTFTFQSIKDKDHYNKIQNFLKNRIIFLGIKNKIFLDLIWNERYLSNSQNLFETNP